MFWVKLSKVDDLNDYLYILHENQSLLKDWEAEKWQLKNKG